MLIATYNSQGSKWHIVRGLLEQTPCEVVCVQECGRIDDVIGVKRKSSVAETPEYDLRYYHWDDQYIVLHAHWGAVNIGTGTRSSRCSMAVVVKSKEFRRVRQWTLCSELATRHPVIAMEWQEVYFMCGHFTAAGGMTAANSAAGTLDRVRKELHLWVCLADYNCSPGELETALGSTPVEVTGPTKPTHVSGAKYDYAAHSTSVKIKAHDVENANGGSDHSPAIFKLK